MKKTAIIGAGPAGMTVAGMLNEAGAECDIYCIMREILSCRRVRNPYTLDRIHVLTVRTSGIEFPIAINEKDLYGSPEPGRRFKGVIWLQGIIQFPGAI